ncbi:MAG: CCA tRNA nucleotidyltransferase [Kiritimatiellae bacterium]|jgi:poly(A) polymerase|nr:CCA tRNA nucleotidyltransferase [Kiritimatiellia bacterium]
MQSKLPSPALLWQSCPAAMRVVEILQDAGFDTFFAGGWVRDLLLGRESKDIDIATRARPDQVETLFPRTHAIGKAFGVIQVVEDGEVFEVATFRRDLAYQDGRRPEGYEPSSPEEDAARRDFTINGLFLDPRNGDLRDYVNGVSDIQAGIIRAIGDPALRFQEDHLRMLRAVRFASVLEFDIEPATRRATQEKAALLTKVSAERIRVEFVRLLTESPLAGDGIQRLHDCGLLTHILPELLNCIDCTQPPEFHPEGDVWTHTLLMLNELTDPSPELALAVLLHDIGKPATRTEEAGRIRFQGHAQVGAEMAEAWMRRMKFSKKQIQTVTGLVHRHMDMMNVPNMRKATLRKIVSRNIFEDELELHRVDCLCSNGIQARRNILLQARREFEADAALPDPWINGRDLIDLGVSPGPEIGKWKHLAYEQQLEGRFPDKSALLNWVNQARD